MFAEDKLKQFVLDNRNNIKYEGVKADSYYISGEGIILDILAYGDLYHSLTERKDLISEDETIGRVLYSLGIDAKESDFKRSEDMDADAGYYRCRLSKEDGYDEIAERFNYLHKKFAQNTNFSI